MRLDGPPTWKVKKVTKEDFENLPGDISTSVRFVFQRNDDMETTNYLCRYDDLNITGTHVNVRYNSDSGEFKFSGCYGRG